MTVVSPAPSRVRTCSHCKHDMGIERTSCPHCAKPLLFPNVDLAEDPSEKAKLEKRLEFVRKAAEGTNCTERLTAFSDACKSTKAIWACSVDRLHRQLTSGFELFQNFNEMDRLRNKIWEVEGLDWDTLRPRAETLLFGSDSHNGTVLYACLSLDQRGLSHYGSCYVTLSDHMIAHRSSCFEGNTAVVYAKSGDFTTQLRCGYTNRHEICEAAFGRMIKAETADDVFSLLIKRDDEESELRDEFIEVHVFGSMTSKTLESVAVDMNSLDFQEKLLLLIVEDRIKNDRSHISVTHL